MSHFAEKCYGPVLDDLIDRQRVSPLGPGTPHPDVRNALTQLTIDSAFAHTRVADRGMAACCLAGLWLHYDYLEESHTISQSIASSTGSFWHGIMHRREEDFSNAKYWFRKVGQHPVFPTLAARAHELAAASPGAPASWSEKGEWDPFLMVDLCRTASTDDPQLRSLCERMAQLEWQALFDFCYDRATD